MSNPSSSAGPTVGSPVKGGGQVPDNSDRWWETATSAKSKQGTIAVLVEENAQLKRQKVRLEDQLIAHEVFMRAYDAWFSNSSPKVTTNFELYEEMLEARRVLGLACDRRLVGEAHED